MVDLVVNRGRETKNRYRDRRSCYEVVTIVIVDRGRHERWRMIVIVDRGRHEELLTVVFVDRGRASRFL